FISSLDEDDDATSSASDDDEEAEHSQSPPESDQEAPERSSRNVLTGLNVISAIPIAAKTRTRSPLKRGREQHIEELNREIDELLDTDEDDDDPENYLSAED
ncbi:hypothetical protein IW145_006034, partial [Coemansia sp. RSA 521]